MPPDIDKPTSTPTFSVVNSSVPPLTEAERWAYLSAMEIDSWLPLATKVHTQEPYWQTSNQSQQNAQDERSLPASLAHTPRTDNAAIAAASVGQVTNTSVDQSIGQTSSSTADFVSTDSVRSTKLPNTVASQPEYPPVTSTVTQPVLKTITPVNLYISIYSAGILVINEMPQAITGAMPASIMELQTAIIAALVNRPSANDTSAANPDRVSILHQASLQWPMVPGPYGDASQQGGQQALAYTLNKLLNTTKTPLTCLLLLGDRAGELLPEYQHLTLGQSACLHKPKDTNEHTTQPNRDGKLALGLPAVSTYSLHQLLTIAANKAAAWQHLQPLLQISRR